MSLIHYATQKTIQRGPPSKHCNGSKEEPMIKPSVVLFLGAGFSKSIDNALPCGAELLKEILTKVDNNTRTAINSLLPEGVRENADAIQPFELLLSIVQRLRSHQLAGRPALIDIDANVLWQKLVEAVSSVTYFKHTGYRHYEDPNSEFGKFIAFLRNASQEAFVSIVTTNYDLIIDKAAQYIIDECLGHGHENGPPKDLRRFQYGCPIRGVWARSGNGDSVLDQEYEPWASIPGIPIYKLHGSTNWAYCDICKELDLSATRHELRAVFNSNTLSAGCPLCGSTYDWLLIPPVPNKNIVGSPILERVWRAAEKALETAECVIFVGYSFPPADPVVLEMVATARLRSHYAHGEPWRYLVFDREDDVCQRYRTIFGGQVQEPQSFTMELLQERWQSTVMGLA